MNNNNKNNNNNKMNNQKPVSAHPDPTTPNQSNGVNDEKNKTAPVSAHPDPVVPNVQQGVEEKKHDAEKHAPHHPGSPESKVPEQHDAIDPSKPLEEQKHPSDHAKAQENLVLNTQMDKKNLVHNIQMTKKTMALSRKIRCAVS